MGVWGAVSGIAGLVGPIAGGVIVDRLGWEWIFFINIPVGVVGVVLAHRLVPEFATHSHRLDPVGVVLSALGMFLLVFGIQEGQTYRWAAGIWALIGLGVLVLAAFVGWQARSRVEPLMALSLFRDRNFSLANVTITTLGFATTSVPFPLTFYAQGVLGLGPTGSGLLLLPLAVVSTVLAPVTGRLADWLHPRWVVGVGMLCWVVSLGWLAAAMVPGAPIPAIVLPILVLGIGNAFVWGPLAATASRNLPERLAGVASGVFTTTRQIGAVLGSAGVGVLLAGQLARDLGEVGVPAGQEVAVTGLPATAHAAFSAATATTMLLPAAVLVVGLVAALCFAGPLRPSPVERLPGEAGEAPPGHMPPPLPAAGM
jgi:MFS family permease